MTKTDKTVFFIIIPGMFMQILGSILTYVVFWGQPLSTVFFGLTSLFILLYPIVWYAFFNVDVKQTGTVPDIKSSVIWGIITGAVIFVVITAFYFVLKDFFNNYTADVKTAFVNLGIINYFIIFAFVLSIFHSFIEEFFWRGFIFRGLMKKIPYKYALLTSSAMFAAHHYIILQIALPFWTALLLCIPIGIGGAAWCKIQRDSRSVIGPWISHFFADFAVMVCIYFMLYS
ncbi:MAG: CPBP family intramembrane metalloprotease [Spirochaetales bacterium]|nr:CPBP family intramembrane metalloprotease [Spirochaetales bacterium]